MPIFINLSKKVRKNVLFISNYPGLATFCSSLKSMLNLMFQTVFQLLSLALFSNAQDSALNSQGCCAPHQKAWSSTNTCAAVIVSRWDAHPTTGENHSTLSKSVQNKKPTKVLPGSNRIAKTPLNQLKCDSAIGYTYFKILTALPTTMASTIFNFGKSKNPISLSSAGSHFYRNTRNQSCVRRKNLSTLF